MSRGGASTTFWRALDPRNAEPRGDSSRGLEARSRKGTPSRTYPSKLRRANNNAWAYVEGAPMQRARVRVRRRDSRALESATKRGGGREWTERTRSSSRNRLAVVRGRGWRVKSETGNERGATAVEEEEKEDKDEEDEEGAEEEEEEDEQQMEGSGTERCARKRESFTYEILPRERSRDSKKRRPAEKRLDSDLRPAANEGMDSLSLSPLVSSWSRSPPAPTFRVFLARRGGSRRGVSGRQDPPPRPLKLEGKGGSSTKVPFYARGTTIALPRYRCIDDEVRKGQNELEREGGRKREKDGGGGEKMGDGKRSAYMTRS